MNEIRIGNRLVGAGHPVYFIAEAGSNHDCNLEQAKRLVAVAAEAGADAVKFQTFRADALYPRSAGMTDYLGDPRSIHEIIKSLEMPVEWIPILAQEAEARGIAFISTPFDLAAVDALTPYVPALKVASYEMTYHGLVQACARTGKPIIVSTGTAALSEVRDMVLAARAAGARELVVLQCTAKYPAPLSALNLAAMQTMARELDVLVGFSDHSREPLPGPMAATALGACVIEKHFTLSNALPGPDHAYALEPDELADVIKQVRAVEKTLGTGIKAPAPEEMELRAFARRSLFSTKAIAAGEPLTLHNTAVLRAGKLPYGMHPAQHVFVLGRTARRAIGVEEPLREEALVPLTLSDGDLTLRPIIAHDADCIVRWRNRPDVHEQLFATSPPTREQHDAWLARQAVRGDRVDFLIELGGRPVGTIALSDIDLGRGTADYGVLIGEPDVRGQHAASRASRLLLFYGFRTLRLQKITLALFADNVAARKLYDKLGFIVVSDDESVEKSGRSRRVTRMMLVRKSDLS